MVDLYSLDWRYTSYGAFEAKLPIEGDITLVFNLYGDDGRNVVTLKVVISSAGYGYKSDSVYDTEYLEGLYTHLTEVNKKQSKVRLAAIDLFHKLMDKNISKTKKAVTTFLKEEGISKKQCSSILAEILTDYLDGDEPDEWDCLDGGD